MIPENAFEQGRQDALQGKVCGKLIFTSTQAHNDYVLGFQAGVKERQAQTPKIRTPIEPMLFYMKEERA